MKAIWLPSGDHAGRAPCIGEDVSGIALVVSLHEVDERGCVEADGLAAECIYPFHGQRSRRRYSSTSVPSHTSRPRPSSSRRLRGSRVSSPPKREMSSATRRNWSTALRASIDFLALSQGVPGTGFKSILPRASPIRPSNPLAAANVSLGTRGRRLDVKPAWTPAPGQEACPTTPPTSKSSPYQSPPTATHRPPPATWPAQRWRGFSTCAGSACVAGVPTLPPPLWHAQPLPASSRARARRTASWSLRSSSFLGRASVQ